METAGMVEERSREEVVSGELQGPLGALVSSVLEDMIRLLSEVDWELVVIFEPDGDPKKKKEGESTGSGTVVIDINEPLSLHSNDTNVFSINAKQMWDELSETYDTVDGYVIFNLHYKINTISQNGSKLFDYYHKLNSLWKAYDTMVIGVVV
ncbi:hypothetical protein Tco_0243413 [Tanacetum coccineum]